MGVFGKDMISSSKRSPIREIGPLYSCVLFIAITFCYLTMHYNDINVTSQYGVVLIDSLFDGKPFSFYVNAQKAIPGGANYDIGIYIIFAIWSIPVWILRKLLNISALSTGVLLWYKALPLLFTIQNSWLTKRIADLIGVSERISCYVPLLYLLTPINYFPVFIAVQYDVIPIFFMLMGYLSLFRKNRKQYLVWFAVAVCMKPFSAFALLLVILYKEKRAIYITWEAAAGASLMLLSKLLYSGTKEFDEQNLGFLAGKMDRLFGAVLPSGQTGIPIFVLLVALIMILAYLHHSSTNDDGLEGLIDKRLLIILTCAIYVAFCIFADIFPYWSAYLAPFLILTLMICGDQVKQALMLDLLGGLCLTLVMIFQFSWVYGGGDTFRWLLLKNIWSNRFSDTVPQTVQGGLARLGITPFIPAAFAAGAACFIAIVFLSHKKSTLTEKDKVVTDQCVRSVITHIRVRIVTVSVWNIVSLMTLFLTRDML